MTTTRHSTTVATPFGAVLERLSKNNQIDGLMIVGSAARDELTASSDYDLVILLSDMPVPIDVGQTYIEHRLTDLNFVTVDEVDRFLESNEPIDPYTTNGRAFLRMSDGKIELDRSGRLKRAQRKVLRGPPLKLFTEREKESRWWMMNLFLRIAERLAVSDDPVNVQAVALMLNGMLENLMLDYFNFRDLLWKGEKEAARYWTSEDPTYLGAYMQCLKEADTRRQLHLYRELAAVTAAPIGDLWPHGHTVMELRPESEDSVGMEQAFQFWESLVADK